MIMVLIAGPPRTVASSYGVKTFARSASFMPFGGGARGLEAWMRDCREALFVPAGACGWSLAADNPGARVETWDARENGLPLEVPSLHVAFFTKGILPAGKE
eukprot:jgi/Tetstr1/453057/TSEL_040093.t1